MGRDEAVPYAGLKGALQARLKDPNLNLGDCGATESFPVEM